MNSITSNEENLLPLVEAFKNIESGEIIISSGWIRSDKLRYVLGTVQFPGNLQADKSGRY